MTFTLKSTTIGRYYITMEIDKYSDAIAVKAYEKIGDCYGYPISVNYYGDTQKATRQFNALKRRFR